MPNLKKETIQKKYHIFVFAAGTVFCYFKNRVSFKHSNGNISFCGRILILMYFIMGH